MAAGSSSDPWIGYVPVTLVDEQAVTTVTSGASDDGSVNSHDCDPIWLEPPHQTATAVVELRCPGPDGAPAALSPEPGPQPGAPQPYVQPEPDRVPTEPQPYAEPQHYGRFEYLRDRAQQSTYAEYLRDLCTFAKAAAPSAPPPKYGKTSPPYTGAPPNWYWNARAEQRMDWLELTVAELRSQLRAAQNEIRALEHRLAAAPVQILVRNDGTSGSGETEYGSRGEGESEH